MAICLPTQVRFLHPGVWIFNRLGDVAAEHGCLRGLADVSAASAVGFLRAEPVRGEAAMSH